MKPRITEETNDKSKIWKLSEINEPSQCRTLKLPENLRVTKVNSPFNASHLTDVYCLSNHFYDQKLSCDSLIFWIVKQFSALNIRTQNTFLHMLLIVNLIKYSRLGKSLVSFAIFYLHKRSLRLLALRPPYIMLLAMWTPYIKSPLFRTTTRYLRIVKSCQFILIVRTCQHLITDKVLSCIDLSDIKVDLHKLR